MARPTKICVGVVIGARGLRGELRFRSHTDPPENAAAYGPVTDENEMRQFDVNIIESSRKGLILTLSGINDRDAADALKGTELYAAREVLPEPEDDEFYHADLVGLPVELSDGSELGVVRSLGEYGAGTVMEITLSDGKPLVVPFTSAAVPVVDPVAGRVVVDPPAGLLGADDVAQDGEEGDAE